MPRIPNRRDDDREPIAPEPSAPIAEAPPAPATRPMATPADDLSPLPAEEVDSDPAVADEAAAPPPASVPIPPIPPIVPTGAHEAEADLLLADAEDPPRVAPARGWRADAQRIYRMVSDELLLVTGGKRLPTIEEIDRAIEGAIARSPAQRRAPAAEPTPAAPQPSPEIRSVAMGQFTESDAVDVRNDSAVVDEAGDPDWLDQQRTGLMEQNADGLDDSLPVSAADRITAIITPPEVVPSELPSDVEASAVDSTSITRTVPPIEADMRSLPDLAYLDRLRRDLADPVASTHYISKIKKRPARMNGIILGRADYLMAAQDGIWLNLNGLPPTKGVINNNQDALAAGLKARQDAIKRLNGEPNLQSITGQPDVRAFVADIAEMTANARLKGGQQYEKYLVIGRRQSDGELVVVAIGTGGQQGGTFTGLAGASATPMPHGITLVAVVHTHPSSVEPQPYEGDPDGVWRKDVPVYTISTKLGLQIFETTRDVSRKTENGKVVPVGNTIQRSIDLNGAAGPPSIIFWP